MVAFCLLYSIFLQFFIVFANDYADEVVDKTNTTYNLFSGGSRVLVEKKITRAHLKYAIFIVMLLSGIEVLLLHIVWQRSRLWLFLLISWTLLWAYSYRPFRLSYRGGGEWLQTIGVGVVLPLTGFYLSVGSIQTFPWIVLLYLFIIQFGAALVTALPDEPSDRAGGKKTMAVLAGGEVVMKIIIACYGAGFGLLLFWVLNQSVASWVLIALSVPSLVTAVSLFWLKTHAVAGNRAMNNFVTVAVASAVLQMAALAVYSWFFNV